MGSRFGFNLRRLSWLQLTGVGRLSLWISGKREIQEKSLNCHLSEILWGGDGHCMSSVLSCFTHVWLFATLRTETHQAPLSMGFSRQEYWSGFPFPPPGHLPDPRIKPISASTSPHCRQILYLVSHMGSPGMCSPRCKSERCKRFFRTHQEVTPVASIHCTHPGQ